MKLSFELLLLVEMTAETYHFEGEATLAIDVTLGWVFSKIIRSGVRNERNTRRRRVRRHDGLAHQIRLGGSNVTC